MKVSVFGLGYVGCVSAAALAGDGHDVVGIDVNTDKVAAINAGCSPIVEPGLDDLLGRCTIDTNIIHDPTESVRRIAFGEARQNTQTKSFNLTAGEINLNDKDKKKSGGALLPAAQLIVNKEGELQFELNQNAWKLVNIIEWK